MSELDAERMEKEVIPLLTHIARPDVRALAMQYFLGLTGTPEGLKFVANNEKYLSVLVATLRDDQPSIAKDAYLALVNLTTDMHVAVALMSHPSNPDLMLDLLRYVLDESSAHVDIACMILSNVSRSERCAQGLADLMVAHSDQLGFHKLIQVFCQEGKHSDKLHYLGPFLSNLTQIREMRKHVLDRERCVVQRLLPYTQYQTSTVRRGGVVGTLRNCCFEADYHEWLLGDDVDILPRLLLPLAGPEEFDDEDNGLLPEDLQYLEPDKERESDPDIRKMLVEAIFQLCAQKPCRKYIKDKNTYVILRELHTWERDPAARHVTEDLISLLIGDEPEPGMEDLNKVALPPALEAKLTLARQKELEEIERETRELQEEEEAAAPS